MVHAPNTNIQLSPEQESRKIELSSLMAVVEAIIPSHTKLTTLSLSEKQNLLENFIDTKLNELQHAESHYLNNTDPIPLATPLQCGLMSATDKNYILTAMNAPLLMATETMAGHVTFAANGESTPLKAVQSNDARLIDVVQIQQLSSHINNTNNPHSVSLGQLTNLDAGTRSITNLAPGLTPTDAITLQQAEDMLADLGTAAFANIGYSAGNVVALEANGKISTSLLPGILGGTLTYEGTWDATNNTPALPDATTSNGSYFIVSNNGVYQGVEYHAGDWIISSGSQWEKIDNTDSITSVFGQTGNIEAAAEHYGAFYAPISHTHPELANMAEVNALLANLVTQAQLDPVISELSLKANTSWMQDQLYTIYNELNTKANTSWVDANLLLLNNALSQKADAVATSAALASKATVVDMQNAYNVLATKADAADLQATNVILATKTNTTDVENLIAANVYVHPASHSVAMIDGLGTAALSDIGSNSGNVVALNQNGKIDTSVLPESILGSVTYQGAWDAANNLPVLPEPTTAKGHYYVVANGGLYGDITYHSGDWAICNGVAWEKVDNTDDVVSVFGQTGVIEAEATHYAAFYAPLAHVHSEFATTAWVGNVIQNSGKILLPPEYRGGVLSALGQANTMGIMTTDRDEAASLNYYQWTSNEATAQSYGVVIVAETPAFFSDWQLCQLTYKTSGNASVVFTIHDTANVQLAQVIGAPSATWTTLSVADLAPLNTGDWSGETFKITVQLQADNGGSAYTSNIKLAYNKALP